MLLHFNPCINDIKLDAYWTWLSNEAMKLLWNNC